MSEAKQPDRRRVLVPQALGSDEFLRATWHRGRGTVVFSHWDGATCVAALPVRVGDLGDLATLVADAAAADPATSWPAPHPEHLVVPAAGLTLERRERSA